MKWSVRVLALPALTMGLGACGTLDRLRPTPVVVTRPVVAPAECRLLPIEPRETEQPALLPEDVTSAAELSRNQLANSRLAFLYWQDRAGALEEAYDVNAASQRVCAQWARSQDTSNASMDENN